MNKNVDFDLDDPLGDLLSDNSNDSFFNDDEYKSKDKTDRVQATSLNKKKSNLFGLEPEKAKENPVDVTKTNKNLSSGDWLGLTDSKTPPPDELGANTVVESNKNTPGKLINKDIGFGTKIQANLQPARSSFPDSLNFLDDLGLSDTETNVNKTNESTAKKSSVFDEVLGKSAVNTQSKRPETPGSVAMPPQKEKNIPSSIGYSPSVSNLPSKDNDSKTRLKIDKRLPEPRRNVSKIDAGKDLIKSPKKEPIGVISKRQRSNADWLGIFPDDDITDVLQDKKEQPQKTTPDWLKKAEIKVNEKNIETDSSTRTQELKNEENNDKNNQDINMTKQVHKQNMVLGVLSKEPLPVESEIFNFPSSLNLIGGSDIGQQSAAICLQQQESQLMVALQLKAQEERLAALRERQEETQRVQLEVVTAQRQQVDSMLQGQADHRAQLQTVIHQHQQRINKHIQSLLMPTPTTNDRNEKGSNNDDSEETNLPKSGSGIDSRIKLTTTEQLNQMIESLRENHSKEIDLTEASYRRQMQIVDESLRQVEDRLKSENDKMANYFALRIEKLEEENLKLCRQSDERIRDIFEKQSADRELMEKKHRSDIAILQEQHRSVIQNIRETLLLEQSTIRDSTDYSQKLKLIMQDIEKNNEICSGFMEKMEAKANSDSIQKEQALNLKEDQLHRMLESLERQRSAFESESHNMKATLQLLEERLRQQTEIIDEDKRDLKKKEIALELERDVFQKKSETLYAIMEREKEIISKNLQNSEASRAEMEKSVAEKLKHLDDEKSTVANEKLMVQNLKSQSQALKLSLENELEELADNKKKILFEQQKLQQSEIKLLARSQELEVLTRSALAKHANAERRISEANYAQQRYHERLKRMQEQAITLNAREQQIARDKVVLSRERLMLYNKKKESEWSPCGLCNADNKINSTKDPAGDEFETNEKYNGELLEMAVSRDNMLNITNNNTRTVINERDVRFNVGLSGHQSIGGLEMGLNGILSEHDISGNDTEGFHQMMDENGDDLAPLNHV